MVLLNITLQISQSQHNDVEKYIVRNIDGSGDSQKTEVSYSGLTAGEKTEYDDIKSFCDGFVSPGTSERVTFQIDESEHGGTKERLIIAYENEGPKILIKNYASLTAGQKTKYNDFKTQATGKAPA